MYDLVIKNAKIVDGTGAPWYRADIAVKDGHIADIGVFDGKAASKVIDAKGLAVCPGFIDPHSHADIVATEVNPENEIYQGVTTQVTGNCGKSNAPVNPETLPLLQAYLGAYTTVDLKWDWTSLGDWLDIIDRQGYVTDLAVLLGQGTVRMAVMGMDDSDPTTKQIDDMKRLVAESMEQGAVGMSTGLIYPPGSFTKTDELVEMCKVVAQYGGIYTSHIRNEGFEELEAVDEAIEIGRRSGCKVHLSHQKVTHPNDGFSILTLAKVEYARSQGIDVTLDVYPYTAGYTQITTLIPKWATVGGVDAMLERLKDPDIRKRVAEDQAKFIPGWENFAKSAGWDGLFISSCHTDHSIEGKSIQQIANERGKSCSEALFDIILKEHARASVVVWSQSESDHDRIVSHPLALIGSDAFSCSYTEPKLQGKPHPRCLGTFPRVVGTYVREKRLFSLETAVYKTTGFTAQRFGLHDRGLIKKGLLADMVIFDPDTIADKGTFTDPYQKPAGISKVIKNGIVVVEGNVFSGKILGKTVRRGK